MSSCLTTLPREVRETLARPELTCEVDVSVRRDDSSRGWVQVHSGQALRGDLVAAVSSAGGRVEVAWWGVGQWQAQRARAATVSADAASEPPPPPGVEVPLDVLLAAGEALRTSRPDILDELVRRSGSADPAALREQLVGLHTAVAGRLLATVAAREGSATARVGWVSWLLFADGWRSLTPTRVAGRPYVSIDAVEPLDLGAQVARLVTVVRGRAEGPSLRGPS